MFLVLFPDFPSLLGVSLIKLGLIRPVRNVPSLTQPGKSQAEPLTENRFSEFFCIYKDLVWAESIKIKRFSIFTTRLSNQHSLEAGSYAKFLRTVQRVPSFGCGEA